jgi:glutamate-5-semialdehyde dehydrogenase
VDVDLRWEATAARLAQRAKEASHPLARATREQKDRVLLRLAESLSLNQDRLLEANEVDVEAARRAEMAPALIDRLVLNPKRIADMIRVRMGCASPGSEFPWALSS